MKRIIVLLFFSLSIYFLSPAAFALNWSINCTNGSCVGSAGRLTLYWTMQNPNAANENAIYNVQQVTGIKGLPFSIENYKQVENNIIKGIDKNLKEQGKAYNQTQTGSKSNNKNQETSLNSFTGGGFGGININYNLQLLRFVAKNVIFGNLNNINSYMEAADLLLHEYYSNRIVPVLWLFLISNNNYNLINLDITKINKYDRIPVLVKWFAYSNYFDSLYQGKYKYKHAAEILLGSYMSPLFKNSLSSDIRESNYAAKELSLELKYPVYKLYYSKKPGYKRAALAKFIAEKEYKKYKALNRRFANNENKLLTAYYVSMIKDPLINPSSKEEIAYVKHEKATIETDNDIKIAVIVILFIAIVIGGFAVYKKKSKKSTAEIKK